MRERGVATVVGQMVCFGEGGLVVASSSGGRVGR